MKNETEDLTQEKAPGGNYAVPISIVAVGVMIAGAILFNGANLPGQTSGAKKSGPGTTAAIASANEEQVLPSEGVVLPVTWGNLGAKLVSVGAIDADKFKAVYDQRGAFTDEYKNLLLGQNDGKLKITNENAGYLLNLLWALGLASKNPILESGEMTNPAYGGAGNFASTGGWTIAQGNAMDHYSKHKFFDLTSDQQALVDKVSRGIYRPCCGNSTHFPDCNHGMAMLGLLELMASQGVSEQDMWKAALAVNSYWFPDTYLTIAAYMKGKGIEWKDVNPQEMLGINYSSAQGYARISAQVSQPQQQRGGSGCGVGAVETVAPQRQQIACGV
ncbi:MAG: hypothetical protein A3C11_02655 [Candidatus Sungbacteria bacterium RIFCSPHIGHO2_02_FULL_49_12]|uniref:Uncharacterized protein n=1 Tax=Candidatus Sungbacteria bacterium RIFCSPHIGHO2_02_FULL_49_12 TaxID=1802271 RepID=A0A1G2KQ54_9BACT|nr:MAG: hypothetical protein A3C11_02655 [Candidatus Sungbacteria bacterium RIFCSPHIGHO2_02_FULL_49_12]